MKNFERIAFIFLLLLSICCCQPQKADEKMTDKKHEPNRLINSSSPYLKQHAYNPVDWYPWGEEALQKAKKEDKPIIVSIGYSSCHWCHVMERESFENDSIAELMNEHFVSIKVDREERPDIDQIYMDAVQAMGQNGGWPLNVFLTSDQKPFYGGTYFPPEAWSQILTNVAQAYETKRDKVEQSAQQLTDALATSEVVKFDLIPSTKEKFDYSVLDSGFQTLAKNFDKELGGFTRAPKFPMPSNWLFLLRYYNETENKNTLDQLVTTLDAIANGGIFDQAGGGWARYSVDKEWLVPHFEKMLYDNGQLVSLYSEAYRVTNKELYKDAVYKTIEWLEREMTEEGGFYSALDADSEGEEGKFYVWTYDEAMNLLGDDAQLITDYYNITEDGNWEEGKNILHVTDNKEEFAFTYNLSVEELNQKIKAANTKFLTARRERVRPGLDDKMLTSWNAIMLKGLVDAYETFKEEKFRQLAIDNATFISNKLTEGNQLYRSYKDDKATIDAYLEDYAFLIDAYLALYQITFDEKWLNESRSLLDYTLEHFYDEKEKLFYFTDDSSEKLIARKKEVFDNVIPASNSQMAINLYKLGVIFDDDKYKETSRTMISLIEPMLGDQIAYLSNWGILYHYVSTPTAEISIVGPEVERFRDQLYDRFLPNKVVMGAKQSSNLPLMKSKEMLNDKTTIYVCYNKTCKLPVNSVEEALKQIK